MLGEPLHPFVDQTSRDAHLRCHRREWLARSRQQHYARTNNLAMLDRLASRHSLQLLPFLVRQSNHHLRLSASGHGVSWAVDASI